MDEQMMKGLQDLIDETIAEVEELKKSKFAASEIKIEGPGDGIAGKPTNGSLDAKKADDDDDDDDEEKKKKKETEDACKAEGTNRQADPNGGSHQPIAKEDTGMPAGTAGSSGSGSAGTNRQADPNGGSHQPVAKDEGMGKMNDNPGQGNQQPIASGNVMQTETVAKSEQPSEDLIKSYVDQRIAPIEQKIESILTAVKEIGDAPVPAKGQNFKDVQPLAKSEQEQTLNKSELANKLFDLKKSGKEVDSKDIASVELGGPAELAKIAERYNLN